MTPCRRVLGDPGSWTINCIGPSGEQCSLLGGSSTKRVGSRRARAWAPSWAPRSSRPSRCGPRRGRASLWPTKRVYGSCRSSTGNSSRTAGSSKVSRRPVPAGASASLSPSAIARPITGRPRAPRPCPLAATSTPRPWMSTSSKPTAATPARCGAAPCFASTKAGTRARTRPTGPSTRPWEHSGLCAATTAPRRSSGRTRSATATAWTRSGVGSVIAFATECYESGLLTQDDTGGLELNWGNSTAVVALTEQIARREGFGAVLADGLKRAAEQIGRGSEQFAMHVCGRELPLHDPRANPGIGMFYISDATPSQHCGPQGLGLLDQGAPLALILCRSRTLRGRSRTMTRRVSCTPGGPPIGNC